jgi:hypothetical protein
MTMTTTPPKSKSAPAPSTPASSSSAAAPAKPKPSGRRTALMVGVLFGIVAAVSLLAVAMKAPEAPPMNADTVTLVKFVTTERYANLPFDRQRDYMYVLEGRDDNDELEASFESGRITEAEYRAAILEAWLGQQLRRTQKYTALSGRARDEYVQSLVEKKLSKKKPDDVKKPATAGADGGKPKVKRDTSADDPRIAKWPAEVRAQYEKYKQAYDAAKDAAEAAAATPKQ